MSTPRELVPATQSRIAEEHVFDDFVTRLRRVCYAATIDISIQVGKLVVDTFYEGDISIWRTRGSSHPSLRELARRPDLPMSLTQLYRCVAVFEMSERIPAICTWKHLCVSHARAVLGLAHEQQHDLLERTEQEQWPVERLEHEVQVLRRAVASRRGRPPMSERTKRWTSVRRWLDDCPGFPGQVDARRLDDRTAADLYQRVRDVRQRCRELEAVLYDRLQASRKTAGAPE